MNLKKKEIKNDNIEFMNLNYKLEIRKKDMLSWKSRSDGRDNDRNDICGDDSRGNSKRIIVVLVDIILLKNIYIFEMIVEIKIGRRDNSKMRMSMEM